MNKIILDETFWSAKYGKGEIGWDVGYVSTPLKEYIDQLADKNLKILIPGGGNSYEAEYLFNLGFTNVFVIDISPVPLQNLLKRSPNFPKENLMHKDFFVLEDTFDLILEQTFFCAQDPILREKYVSKMSQLLKHNGHLVGLLFAIPLNEDKPPFGGSEEEYRELFEKEFIIKKMEVAYNSIPPRSGNELFIDLIKK